MDWGYLNFDLNGNLISIQNADSILSYSAKFNDNGSIKKSNLNVTTLIQVNI